MTSSVPRRFLIALVLATYGLVSAGGSGLHALADGGGKGSSVEQQGGSHHHDSDHGDCLICLVTGQSQLALGATPPADPARVTREGPSLPPLANPRSLDHIPSDPRAPPVLRA